MTVPVILPPPTPKRTVYLSFMGPINEQNVEALIARVNGEINTGATTIHLLLTSLGGGVIAGFAAYTLLKGLPVELVTHNTGNISSIANVVFLAGAKRYACPSSTFYFHGTSGGQPDSNAAMLQSSIEGINIDDGRTIDVIAKETGMTPAEVRGLVSSVGVTKTATSAQACGLVHELRDVVIPPGASFFQFILTR